MPRPFARFKLQFFDSDVVIKAIGRANAKALGQFGRMVRKAAQASLKYDTGGGGTQKRDKFGRFLTKSKFSRSSAPGQPPLVHRSRKRTRTSKSTGKTRTRSVSFLREFLFYQYDNTTKSVVVGPERLNSTVDPNSLPALEYGGRSTGKDRKGKPRSISIAARPFMRPALEAERPGLAALWRDSVK